MSANDEAKENLIELGADSIDTAIDLLTESELFQEIPMAGMLWKIAKAARSIPDIIFLKKAERFIKTVNNKTTQEERLLFSKEIKKDQAKRDNLYNSIFLKIDKFDDFTKSDLFAKIFSCYIVGKLEEREFVALSSALNLASMQDFHFFCKSYWGSSILTVHKIFKNSTFDKKNYGSLVTANLMMIRLKTSFSSSDPLRMPSSELEFVVTESGELFALISQDLEECFNPLAEHEKLYVANHDKSYRIEIDWGNKQLKERIDQIRERLHSQ
ncbi:hypothetical protein [Nodosilinea sp. FACHB-13]|uniref:hypothetical protein n=1 Tax=Cyanophyceae TaxID=3028117 RepID=UPI001682EB0B|nr:hypothetical protein [Nodosilinea sp. FACHB-13]MBD2106292.1 hypothetical protein [Nodosilinea sp. FACHB-13]